MPIDDFTRARIPIAKSGFWRVEDVAGWIASGRAPTWAALGALGALVVESRARDAASFIRWQLRSDVERVLARLFAGPPERPRRIPWSIGPFIDGAGSLRPLGSNVDPDRLASAWLAAIGHASTWQPHAVATLEVEGDRLTLGALELLLEVLAPRHAPTAAVVVDQHLGSGGDFRWPIRVAFTGATPKKDLRARIERYLEDNHRWVSDLVEFVDPSGPHEAVDLLIASGSLDKTIDRLNGVRHGIDAHTLVVVGAVGEASAMTPRDLGRALEPSVDPWAVAVVDVPDRRIEAWFVELIRHLSQDLSLEHALRVMASRNETGLPFVVAESRALATMNVRSAAERAIEALPKAHRAAPVILPDVARAILAPGRWARSTLLEAVRERDAFDQERRGAFATSALNRWREMRERTLATQLARAEPPDRREVTNERKAKPIPPRYLQAALFHAHGQSTPPVVQPLEPAQEYVLRVRVGKPSARWARGAIPAPLADVQRDQRRHRLRVTYDPLDGKTQPTTRTIDLPLAGNSSVCQFDVTTSTTGALRGRLILSFRNRVLQTALVTATTMRVEIEIETVVRPGLTGLSTRRAFDIAFVHNHVPSGATHVTALAGTWTPSRRVDLDISIEAIRGFLTDAAKQARRHTGLASQPTVGLLVDLARQGFNLRKLVITEGDPDGLGDPATSRRVQVVSVEAGALFPVEIFYDYPPPQVGAALCPNAMTALDAGRCDADEYHGTPAGSGEINVVCPAGFWSMNRVIERYASPRKLIPDLLGYDYGVRSEPLGARDVLGDLSDALFAWSNLVSSTDAKTVVTALSTLLDGTSTTASTWDEWLKRIKASGPGLLVLLSHTDVIQARRDSALVIATSDRCYATTFGRSFVREALRPDATPDERPGPVVLLLGCDTTHAWSQYQSFVSLFRENHAALVIGTVGSVAARHAPTVAVKLIEQLASRASGGATAPADAIGDVMLTARQQLLKSGEVMALALSSYGDADWRLN